MCAAPLLAAAPGERVLDLCSAPGGKGTQLAQAMRGQGILVLNEKMPDRARILLQNVERMGVTNAVVTCADPAALADRFEGYFDKILVDAPCSGEGMLRKEAAAAAEWSRAERADVRRPPGENFGERGAPCSPRAARSSIRRAPFRARRMRTTPPALRPPTPIL